MSWLPTAVTVPEAGWAVTDTLAGLMVPPPVTSVAALKLWA